MQRLIQLVHIGKSQLKMDEESYRYLLKQQFNQSSSQDLTQTELRQLITILQAKGATIRLPFGRSQPLNPMQKKLWAIWKSMADNKIISVGSSKALDVYVQRLFAGKTWCTLNQAEMSQVIESLKQWQKRLEG